MAVHEKTRKFPGALFIAIGAPSGNDGPRFADVTSPRRCCLRLP
jgi:hypothetical protein